MIDENVKYILIISEVVSPKQKLKVIQEDPADDRCWSVLWREE